MFLCNLPKSIFDSSHTFRKVAPLALAIALCIQEASAQNSKAQIIHFDLPADSLASSLIHYAKQASLSIIVEKEQLKKFRSSPVIGSFEPKQALDMLLSNSPFTFNYDANKNTVVIIKKEMEPESQAQKAEVALVEDTHEEVLVTGIRASLLKAMGLKLSASEILDALTQEEIGKFPDSNLSEAMQRISGLTLEYENNEGALISVRGLDPSFNLVTLNGRQMPSAVFKPGSFSQSRSFSFANLASENISAIEVFKTPLADKLTGGIASQINILTPRPLELEDTNISFGVKAVSDSSNKKGSNTTPEYSALASSTFADGTIGLLASASYQERDSRAERAFVDWFENLSLRTEGNAISTRELGDYWYPLEIEYSLEDFHRTRSNAQFVFQFSPGENLISTIDYTLSELSIESSGLSLSRFAFGEVAETPTIDSSNTVLEVSERSGEHLIEIFESGNEQKSSSFGFNLDWQVHEDLALVFDVHSSSAKYKPIGRGSLAKVTLGLDNISGNVINTGFDIPQIQYNIVDANGQRSQLTTNDVSSRSIGQVQSSNIDASIRQFQFDGNWHISDIHFLREINFGGAKTDAENKNTYREINLFSIGVDSPPYSYNENIFYQENADILNQFSGGTNQLDYFIAAELSDITTANAERLRQEGRAPSDRTLRGWQRFTANNELPSSDHRINEDIESLYIQLKAVADIPLPLEILAGIRYEKTDVESSSEFLVPNFVNWVGPGNYITVLNPNTSQYSTTASYDDILPSLALRLDFTDELLLRAAYTKSISRPEMELMHPQTQLNEAAGPFTRTAVSGNPGLEPYSANNIDLSVEWYYSDTSYLSLGFFQKDIDNFPTADIATMPLFNLTDPSSGPRADAIRQELSEQNVAITEESLFHFMSARYGDIQWSGNTGMFGVIGNAQDAPLQWRVTRPQNNEQFKLRGWEFAWQHLFGESGFGSSFNYTHVDSASDYQAISNSFQLSLPRTGDFLNLAGFYDKHGLQLRLAYHWNDEFVRLEPARFSNVNQIHTEAYGQLDVLASYAFAEHFTVFFEGINVTDETQRSFNAQLSRLHLAEQYGPRYQLGFRYNL